MQFRDSTASQAYHSTIQQFNQHAKACPNSSTVQHYAKRDTQQFHNLFVSGAEQSPTYPKCAANDGCCGNKW